MGCLIALTGKHFSNIWTDLIEIYGRNTTLIKLFREVMEHIANHLNWSESSNVLFSKQSSFCSFKIISFAGNLIKLLSTGDGKATKTTSNFIIFQISSFSINTTVLSYNHFSFQGKGQYRQLQHCISEKREIICLKLIEFSFAWVATELIYLIVVLVLNHMWEAEALIQTDFWKTGIN